MKVKRQSLKAELPRLHESVTMNMNSSASPRGPGSPTETVRNEARSGLAVTLLTGGGDRPYAFGLATELIKREVALDLIGSDDLDCPEFHGRPGVRFLNLRGDQRPGAGYVRKGLRVGVYYAELIRYALTAKPKIFHILWNNKFQTFDRTLLMLYYRLLGKKIILTVHNVNAGRRDSKDTFLNRLTLRVQYRLTHHLFVHTEKMKLELVKEFGVEGTRVTVIPFGINNAVPNTELTPKDAKRRLGLQDNQKVVLFFGNIAPYKGLEYLVAAFKQLIAGGKEYCLVIAGRPKDCEEYWRSIQSSMQDELRNGKVLVKAEYIADEETEVYFKAADVLVLPYTHIYQSGVLFLGHSFGLPVLAADVGSLRDEIIEDRTGFVFRPQDPVDLTKALERYFASDLFKDLDKRRQEIRDHAAKEHSWDTVGELTLGLYAALLRLEPLGQVAGHDSSKTSLDAKTAL